MLPHLGSSRAVATFTPQALAVMAQTTAAEFLHASFTGGPFVSGTRHKVLQLGQRITAGQRQTVSGRSRHANSRCVMRRFWARPLSADLLPSLPFRFPLASRWLRACVAHSPLSRRRREEAVQDGTLFSCNFSRALSLFTRHCGGRIGACGAWEAAGAHLGIPRPPVLHTSTLPPADIKRV